MIPYFSLVCFLIFDKESGKPCGIHLGLLKFHKKMLYSTRKECYAYDVNGCKNDDDRDEKLVVVVLVVVGDFVGGEIHLEMDDG